MVSSTPRPHFTPGKDPVPILQEAGWAPGPVWTGGKSRPYRDSIRDRPARSQSLYRLSYPADRRNEYQEYFLGDEGGRCAGLTNLPPSCADFLEIWEPQLPGALWACNRPEQGLIYLYLYLYSATHSSELLEHLNVHTKKYRPIVIAYVSAVVNMFIDHVPPLEANILSGSLRLPAFYGTPKFIPFSRHRHWTLSVSKSIQSTFPRAGEKNDHLSATEALIFIYLATHLLFSTRHRLLKGQSLSVTCGGEEITRCFCKVRPT